MTNGEAEIEPDAWSVKVVATADKAGVVAVVRNVRA